MLNTGASRVGLSLLALLLGGCAARPKMEPGVALHVRRGHCLFVETEFRQRGVARDRADVLEQLEKEPRSAPYVQSAHSYSIGSTALVLVAGGAGVVSTLNSGDEPLLTDEASTALLIGGVASALAAWMLCGVAEEKYAVAADAYSAPLPRTEPERPVEPKPAEPTESIPASSSPFPTSP